MEMEMEMEMETLQMPIILQLVKIHLWRKLFLSILLSSTRPNELPTVAHDVATAAHDVATVTQSQEN
jgi:hypothetical protein